MAITLNTFAPTASQSLSQRLNWLRAGVLGANDGIVSTAGLVFGVAGATTDSVALLIAGLAGMVAGALSMAGGEYVSVSSQKDSELAAIRQQQAELHADPEGKLQQLAGHYAERGLSPELSVQVARELSEHAALDAHAQVFLKLDADEQVSPWAAARASLVAFIAGSVIPLVVIITTPLGIRLPLTVAAVLAALVVTGVVSARLGGARALPAVIRNVAVGSLAMGLTYLVGWLVGQQL
ncbi:MAG TPA: VIT family protein [Propionicimonas sp.]|jgi:VIT1/CCC1 family predicted Fe2+/Mn2+ transporter|uniref:VIT1/CCC1 transporter family protein n=1 Tax=Propionicimonas sp. TaxID=1955623 RepID=UPI002F3F5D1C